MAVRRQTALAAAAAAGTGSMMESARRSVASESRMVAAAAVTRSMIESGRKRLVLARSQAAAAVGWAMAKRDWAAAAVGLVMATSAHLPTQHDKFLVMDVPSWCCSSILAGAHDCSSPGVLVPMQICTCMLLLMCCVCVQLLPYLLGQPQKA